jgi:Mg/Co/Ni transporter MgtE
MQTKTQSDELLDRINEATTKHVPQKLVIRDGANVGSENPEFVVRTVLRQLFRTVRNQVNREIPLSESDITEEIERQRFVALSEKLRQKMVQIIAGNIPDEIQAVCNTGETPIQSIEWTIGDSNKNVSHFVGLVMDEVFQEKAA